MILSMTGFGEAQAEVDGHAYHIELRSVNNRYFKAVLRLPEDHSFLELELEQLLRSRLTRGSVLVRLAVRDLSAEAAFTVNVAAIRAYVSQMRAALPDEGPMSLDLGTLAMLPGVCQPPELDRKRREQVWATVSQLAQTALDGLLEMRAREGRALAAELQSHCAGIRAHLDAIRDLAPRVLDHYRERLLLRVRRLIADSSIQLAHDDLLKEVSVFADRSDISEELARLRSHLEQLEAGVTTPEPAGRKLEFLAQELMREANTIGAKAGDREIARRTIEIKSAVDRIKEQVQNVE
jgi:uncharacterized protein (TIGR00255 family)